MKEIDTITLGVDIDKESLDKTVAEIESAFPKVIFNGNVNEVYINYTQNNFNANDEETE